jgi:MGT family glycosyltransferase
MCFFTHFVLEGSQGLVGFGAVARFIWRAIPHLPTLMQWKRRMKQRYGGSIVGGITEYGDLNLVFTSKEFHPANKFIDERFRFVGPSINTSTRDDARSGDFPFEQLSAGTRVYISLGTINHLDLPFYRAVFAAFADYPAQFILSVGKNTDITQLGETPANFIVRGYVPQLEILQQVDAFITHGGMNSVHEGLMYSVPQVVVPHQIEQLLNGKRVAQTGVGVLLGDSYPYGQATAEELRQSLDTVLSDPSYRQRACHFGETLNAAGGYHQAVAEIETLLGEKSHVQQQVVTSPSVSLA